MEGQPPGADYLWCYAAAHGNAAGRTTDRHPAEGGGKGQHVLHRSCMPSRFVRMLPDYLCCSLLLRGLSDVWNWSSSHRQKI